MKKTGSIDYHIHESHSKDAYGTSIEAYIQEAEKKGMKDIAFTTHLIVSSEDKYQGIQIFEIEKYIEEIEKARDNTSIKLRTGLEVDYFRSELRLLEFINKEFSFDFMLGSTHYIKKIDIGSKQQVQSFFEGRNLEDAIDEYFSVWKEAIETGLFDVMAHPDYWRKFFHIYRDKPAMWEEYGSVIHEAIDSLVENRVGFEVNTSGYRFGLNDNFPIQEFLHAAFKAGVKHVTVGSDCHTVSNIGFGTYRAIKQLDITGFKNISIYEDRKSHLIPIKSLL
jgi:histidinol-phosphatase (PHP family)